MIKFTNAIRKFKSICFAVLFALITSTIPVLAEEGYLCPNWYEHVQRKEKIIKSYGADLSDMAKLRLFDDLKTEVKLCISECEGAKFKYCNEISKWISE